MLTDFGAVGILMQIRPLVWSIPSVVNSIRSDDVFVSRTRHAAATTPGSGVASKSTSSARVPGFTVNSETIGIAASNSGMNRPRKVSGSALGLPIIQATRDDVRATLQDERIGFLPIHADGAHRLFGQIANSIGAVARMTELGG